MISSFIGELGMEIRLSSKLFQPSISPSIIYLSEISFIRFVSSTTTCFKAFEVIISLASQSRIIYSTSVAVNLDEIGV